MYLEGIWRDIWRKLGIWEAFRHSLKIPVMDSIAIRTFELYYVELDLIY
jgi:hypothetical protein